MNRVTAICRHECPCGAVLTCGDADRCAAGAFWRCFACELDHYDDYITRRANEPSQHEGEQDHHADLRIGQ